MRHGTRTTWFHLFEDIQIERRHSSKLWRQVKASTWFWAEKHEYFKCEQAPKGDHITKVSNQSLT